ncbi:MAG: N-acetylneuraminate synthase family protein, partial [Rhodospirillales bacterium]|nr:N-acetylneuraminate synthase family protein [Rhodospirillales bacterium]
MSTYIIAEIGINHNGDLSIAKELIRIANEIGCDAVKFQKRTINVVYSPEVLDAPRKSPWGETQREQKEGLEFGEDEYDDIDTYCRELGIDWFASAWDIGALDFLKKYKSKYNKIASAMTTNLDFLEAVANEGKKTFISTGMCGLDDVQTAVDIFRRKECEFVLLHSVSLYPAPEEVLNLKCIETLRKQFDCPVGYSGHEASLFPSVMAAVLGAEVIERHITLDRAMYG